MPNFDLFQPDGPPTSMASASLNSAQRTAVEHSGRALLVIAGAGSGKTRVLTSRVAWLLEQGVAPEAILAFTFTNRAAREMRERIAATTGPAAERLWVGTFHATAVRLLRREADALGLPRAFAIYDRDDQESVLKDVIRALGWQEGSYKLSQVLGRISEAKNALVTPEDFARTAFAPESRRHADAYERYQQQLRASGALDFDDLIAETVRLFRVHPDIASRYRDRFRHVLVDEYQDTNHAQFRLIQALVGEANTVFVVGDDDQSIYGWRGADLANVLDFERTFPGAAVVRLEQNYRSTGNILDAANAVIANNRARKGKNLWSDRGRGRPLRFVLAADEVREARTVRHFVARRVRDGGRLADCAVLYRTNAQSRALETELRHALIPYEVVGGIAFYQRREVKDLVAYLRAAVNPQDTAAFWRIWNTPRRGLGAVVRAAVEQRMGPGIGPVAALRALWGEDALPKGARSGARDLLDLLDEIAGRADHPVDRTLAHVLERTRYIDSLEGEEDAAERRANVEELVVAASGFSGGASGALTDFLAEAALVTDADRAGEKGDRVLLLTAHNAKGLEFDAVAVIGLEEGLMPHAISSDRTETLEEERRLFYVALTRAREEVLLTAAGRRRRYDGTRAGVISRFVQEIPRGLLEWEEEKVAVDLAPSWRRDEARPVRRPSVPRAVREDDESANAYEDDDAMRADTPLRLSTVARADRRVGQRVRHATYGEGVVVEAEEGDGDIKYTVRFGTRIKKIVGRFLEGVR